MAMTLGNQSTGAKDRTGTIAFMATSILRPEQCIHRPIHDCESIFWLCALDLLCRVGIGATGDDLANIMNSGRDIGTVRQAKSTVMSGLSVIRRKTQKLKSSFSLDDPKDSSLFFCLTALAREFFGNDYGMDYESAEEGFEGVCFDRCIEIIEKAKP
jgi:hypothetical protein